jgi:hypothetical protein
MEHAGARVLPAEMEIYREVEQDEQVIDRIAAAQREDGSAISPQADAELHDVGRHLRAGLLRGQSTGLHSFLPSGFTV